MFLILLGIATCADICYQKVSGNTCPPQTTACADEAAILAALGAGAGPFTIYTDTTISTATTLLDTNIAKVSAIIALSNVAANIPVTITLAAAATVPSLTLSKIDLTVTPTDDEKLTCTSLILKDDSSIVAASAANVIIKDLTCTSIKAGKDAIAQATGSVTINGKDVIAMVKVASKALTIEDYETSSANTATFKANVKVNITSTVTKTAAFEVDGTFNDMQNIVSITLDYGNTVNTVLTLTIAASTTASATPIVTVNTYSKFAAGAADAPKAIFKLNTDFALDADGNRVNVPKSDAYCLIKQSETNDCPDDSVVLWGTNEISKMNKDGLITLYVTGYAAANDNLVLKLSDFKDKKIKFSSTKPENTKQNIQFDVETKDEATTGEIQFDNIKITASYPKDTDGTGKITFNKLLVRKSEFASEVKTTSMKLKALEITAEAKDLTSDISSFNKIKFPKPTKFTLIDVTKAEFTGDGKSVKINSDSDTLTTDNIPVPFTIATLPGQKVTTPAEFSIAENEGKPGTALGFSFDVAAGSDLSVKYDGDWSANKIIVNVASKDSKFEGIKGTDAKSPNMEASGEGKAQLDGNDIPKPEPPAGTPTPKGGLSGGAIAGIVIACVVVVAAVVVVVVVVIKKKKGKVAN